MKRKIENEKGITLVALIITIIILIILVAVTINALTHEGLAQLAVKASESYQKMKSGEIDMLNEVNYNLKVGINKRPRIQELRYSDRTASSIKIKAMATDGDRESLTYKVYIGTSKDNLIEQADVKKDVEQGKEVTWTVPIADSTSVYYYKIIVSDKYSETVSEIRKTNNAPVLGEITLIKDIDETKGNWIKVITNGTDTENDMLTFSLKMWKKEEGVNDETLVVGQPTKIITKDNIESGQSVELMINDGLEEYTEYLYRVDIADNENNVIGTRATIKTYCSGTGLTCSGIERM